MVLILTCCLLGRPWLSQAKVKQNWERNRITLRRGHKRRCLFRWVVSVIYKQEVRPVIAETINMVEGLDDDEEEEFLKANADLLPLCSVDLELLYISSMRAYSALVKELSLDDGIPEDVPPAERMKIWIWRLY